MGWCGGSCRQRGLAPRTPAPSPAAGGRQPLPGRRPVTGWGPAPAASALRSPGAHRAAARPLRRGPLSAGPHHDPAPLLGRQDSPPGSLSVARANIYSVSKHRAPAGPDPAGPRGADGKEQGAGRAGEATTHTALGKRLLERQAQRRRPGRGRARGRVGGARATAGRAERTEAWGRRTPSARGSEPTDAARAADAGYFFVSNTALPGPRCLALQTLQNRAREL